VNLKNPDFIPTGVTTSHSTKLPNNGNQVAGYAALRKNFLLTYNPYAARQNKVSEQGNL
jgi:hypothetical protein